jgi:hypothetical protein
MKINFAVTIIFCGILSTIGLCHITQRYNPLIRRKFKAVSIEDDLAVLLSLPTQPELIDPNILPVPIQQVNIVTINFVKGILKSIFGNRSYVS